jgi:hypothetical protein
MAMAVNNALFLMGIILKLLSENQELQFTIAKPNTKVVP